MTPTRLSQKPAARREPGFRSYEVQMTDDVIASRDLRQDEYLLQQDGEENQAALFRILATLRKRGIQPVFLRLPRLKAYSEARSAAWTAREEALVQAVRKQEGAGMCLLDYRDVPWLQTSHFSDTRHLNTKGAEVFTRHLDEDLRAYLSGYQTGSDH